MKNPKNVVLMVVVVILLASTIFLGVLISNESNPTGNINTRASEDLRGQAYKSISNTPAPGAQTSPSAAPTAQISSPAVTSKPSSSPTPVVQITQSQIPTPTFGNVYVNDPLPTYTTAPLPTYTAAPVPPADTSATTQLPETGFYDVLPYGIGAAVLILGALVL